MKLEILHLFAALLIDKSEDTWWSQSNSSPGRALVKYSPDLTEALQTVLAEVRAVAQKVFEELLSGSSGSRSVSISVFTL